MLVSGALRLSENPVHGDYRSSRFPELTAEVTTALLDCTSESGVLPTDAMLAGRAVRLANALAAIRTPLSAARPLPNWP
ncbi:hypothetical protein D9M72_515620 [compost metagenome]